ncbi:IclR family transcriptional regulator [Nakamurella lactea]|uniref:IclR family transcriptional regulator n=1 Tax=Nakamurella lactea TaxID=459515 RepID=UPI00048F9359
MGMLPPPPDRPPKRAPERSSALDRGLAVLALLADHPEGLTVSELAGRMSLSRPVVYRLLASLLDHGYARRSGDGRVSIGPGVLRLSQRAQSQVRRVAVPILRRLAEATGATAHLSLADGDEAVAVAVVEPSWTDFHVAYRTGSRHPLERGAAGRAILAARGGRMTAVESSGELQPGAWGLAVAVPSALLEASVGVVALGTLDQTAVVDPLQQAATALARAIGP